MGKALPGRGARASRNGCSGDGDGDDGIPLKAETENGELILEPSEDAVFRPIIELALPDESVRGADS